MPDQHAADCSHARRRSPGAGSTGRWLVVALLGVIAACLLIEVGAGRVGAQGPTHSAGAGGAFIVAGQITRDTYGLYLVDTEHATMALYEYQPSSRKLRLLATRTYTFDVQLDEYNTELSPREVRELVAQQKRLEDTPARP